jgi:hypothetical protein
MQPQLCLFMSTRRDVLLVTIASDMATFGTNSAAQVEKHVAQRPDHEFLFFSLLSLHLMRRRSGLLSSRQCCALTPRMRTEI